MIFLDTCTFLWLVLHQSQFSAGATACLRQNAGLLCVSPLTAFEIGQKAAAGKLDLELPPARWFSRAFELHGLRECAFTSAIALRASALPRLHADLFDGLQKSFRPLFIMPATRLAYSTKVFGSSDLAALRADGFFAATLRANYLAAGLRILASVFLPANLASRRPPNKRRRAFHNHLE